MARHLVRPFRLPVFTRKIDSEEVLFSDVDVSTDLRLCLAMGMKYQLPGRLHWLAWCGADPFATKVCSSKAQQTY